LEKESEKMQEISMKVMPKTVYTDIVTLPDPMLLGITIHYYNHSDDTLYMKIFGSGPSPWSSNAVELGSLAGGLNTYIHLDNFLSRTKPSVGTTEVLTLTLRGYSDAGYSQLVYEFQRTCTIIMIKSDDGSWTTDFLNNFDDGTVQGWAAVKDNVFSGAVTLDVATDFILSTPYALRMQLNYELNYDEKRARLYKSFTTPNRNEVFAVFNVRNRRSHVSAISKNLNFTRDGTVLVFLGRPYDTTETEYFPRDRWVRVVVPLPKNTTLELRVVQCMYCNVVASGYFENLWLYVDDFKIISK